MPKAIVKEKRRILHIVKPSNKVVNTIKKLAKKEGRSISSQAHKMLEELIEIKKY